MGNKINIDGTILSDSLNRASITVEVISNENIIRFNTNSSEKLTIDSSGNLGKIWKYKFNKYTLYYNNSKYKRKWINIKST